MNCADGTTNHQKQNTIQTLLTILSADGAGNIIWAEYLSNQEIIMLQFFVP
jgi:hypothetical protein